MAVDGDKFEEKMITVLYTHPIFFTGRSKFSPTLTSHTNAVFQNLRTTSHLLLPLRQEAHSIHFLKLN